MAQMLDVCGKKSVLVKTNLNIKTEKEFIKKKEEKKLELCFSLIMKKISKNLEIFFVN